MSYIAYRLQPTGFVTVRHEAGVPHTRPGQPRSPPNPGKPYGRRYVDSFTRLRCGLEVHWHVWAPPKLTSPCVSTFLTPSTGPLCMFTVGLLSWIDPVKVTILFTWYIVADFAWILIEPDAVPSMPNVILLHHFVTFVLLCFPLQYPHLARYTCWDGICEINTFFLIARRQWKSVRGPFSFLYWATFFPLRIVLYPLMLVYFYHEMKSHALWQMITVCGSQVVLIGFNAVLLSLSIMNWRKRSHSAGSAGSTPVDGQSKAEAEETTKGKAKAQGSAQVIKAQAIRISHQPMQRNAA